MQDRRWRRILGKTIAGQQLEEFFPQVSVPWEVMRNSLPGTRQAGAGNSRNADHGFICPFVDPGVGGFAAGDILAEFPGTTENFSAISSPIAPITTASFAPGWWRFRFSFACSAAYAQSAALTLRPIEFDDSSTGIGGPGFVGSVGQGGFILRGIGIAGTYDFGADWYIPEEWKLRLQCGTALTDTQTAWVMGELWPLLLLDGEGLTQ